MISFVQPTALWLLLLIPLFWLAGLYLPRRLSPRRLYAALALRTAMALTLILALAGVQLVWPTNRLTTVFLLDTSDSVAPAQRARAEAFVQAALAAQRPDDRAALVVFGERAQVERAPEALRSLGPITAIPGASRTDIASALQVGLALLPNETGRRIVLLSDGGENLGDARAAAQIAALRNVAISYLDLSTTVQNDVLLDGVRAPGQVRQGQAFDLTVTVTSDQAQLAELRLLRRTESGETLLEARPVQLAVGSNSFIAKAVASSAGFERYRAEIVVASDARPQNNQAEALVRVDGPPRVLIVAGEPAAAENLTRALAATDVSATLVTPAGLPSDLAGLASYEALLLLDVPADALPARALPAIESYVRDLGRGLVMIGGERSFGVGGFSKTPVENALPVYMDVRDKIERPDLALIFVIDKSGSMDACHCNSPDRQSGRQTRSGTPKIDIAKQAVAQATAQLKPRDTVGVVAFDSAARWVVPAQAGTSAEAVESALAPISPDGGTNVRAGLQAAEEALRTSTAKIKHVILLTDGWSSGGDNLDVAQRLRDSGATLTVVAAGSGSAEYLQRLAQTGGGRYYPSERMEDVPQIFVQETIRAVGTFIVEQPFTPRRAIPSPITEPLTDVPQLYGLNGTTPKETASVALTGPDDVPLLASWQYGLGRSVAWTSDVRGKWARDWVAWDAFPRFAARMVSWVLPQQRSDGMEAEVQFSGAQTLLTARLKDPSGKPLDAAEVRATVAGTDGTPQTVTLSEVAPGEYRGALRSPAQGSYLVQLSGTQQGQPVAQTTVGMVVPYSPEYRQARGDPALLAELARLTGGVTLATPAAAVSPAAVSGRSAREFGLPLLVLTLLLLPLDIAVRRLSLGKVSSVAWRSRVAARAGVPAGQQQQPPSASVAAAPPTPIAADERLQRLAEARERARRRARGEE